MEIGQSFEANFELTEDIYFGFISIFKDSNPLHTDFDFAKSKGFKSRVMHGNILNGFLSYFIGECLPIKNVIIHSQEIYYKNPVYLYDKLKLEAIAVNFFESVSTYEFKFRFINTHSKIVAKGKIQIGII